MKGRTIRIYCQKTYEFMFCTLTQKTANQNLFHINAAFWLDNIGTRVQNSYSTVCDCKARYNCKDHPSPKPDPHCQVWVSLAVFQKKDLNVTSTNLHYIPQTITYHKLYGDHLTTESKPQTLSAIDAYCITRGSQEPVIAHLVFNLTSKVDRKWGCYT